MLELMHSRNAATGHKTETQNAKDATCTTDGYTGDQACDMCGEIVETGTVIPATGRLCRNIAKNESGFWEKK